MTDKQKGQRQQALTRSGGICPICGGSINQYGTPQYAHKIANTEVNRSKYGSFFMDHFLNGEYVCSLACNSSCNIGNNPGEVLKLLTDILLYEIKRFEVK